MMSRFILFVLLLYFSCKIRCEDNISGRIQDEERNITEVEGTRSFFEGDIAVRSDSSQERSIGDAYVTNNARFWPRGVVPYKIDKSSIIDQEYHDLIREGLAGLEEVATCLKFTEIDGEAVEDYFLFRSHGDDVYPGKGCWSYIGRQGGQQVINLEPPDCMKLEHIQHEVIHALGGIHEHSRPDRDKYIRIQEDKIEKGKLSNFNISEWDYDNELKGVDDFGAPYDLYSIMHYRPESFGINGARTIEAVNPKIKYFGTTGRLTLTDIMKLNLKYQCDIESGTIVDYIHEKITTDDSEITSSILQTIEEKTDQYEEKNADLHKKIEIQELRIEQLETDNKDFKEKLDVLLWRVDSMENSVDTSIKDFEQKYDKNILMVQDKLQDHENESTEILSRLEDKVSEEILFKDTVEDLSLLNVKRTCQEYVDSGIKRSGYFLIDPDGPLNTPNPTRVWCDITSEIGITEVLHDNELTTNINHCSQPGCYARNITYESSRSQIRALLETSEHCSQDIRYDCSMAPLRYTLLNVDFAFWVGDDGRRNIHWDDSSEEGAAGEHVCSCHAESNCYESDKLGNTCNCDASMAIGKFDQGQITNISLLPIRELRFGGMTYSSQSAQHTLGRLKCWGTKMLKSGSSCEALRIAGNYFSGYYNIREGQEDSKLVYCNMTLNPWDGPELEIFVDSLAEEIETIQINMSSKLDDLEVSMNETIQNVAENIGTLQTDISSELDDLEMSINKTISIKEKKLRKMPGPPGKQGQRGEQGYVGPKGNKGDIGLDGKTGSKGDKGTLGRDGTIGPKGAKGNIGSQGTIGIKGKKGTIGQTGASGPKGDKGAIGLQGYNGSKGQKGKVGSKGEVGSQGVKGEKGSTGQKGLEGKQGISGANGPPGQQGTKGAQGVKGASGKCGFNVKSCKEMKNKCPYMTDGLYTIYPNGVGQIAVKVYCEMTTDGGGWTVMSYLRNKQQWDYKLFEDNGVVGDVSGGFSTGAILKKLGAKYNEKLIVYLALEENKKWLGRQWMIDQRPDAVTFSAIQTDKGWSYRDSFGHTKADAGDTCTHECGNNPSNPKFSTFGMFLYGWSGTQGGHHGCRDGNNICWMPRSMSCNVGDKRCALLVGPGEGVIYAVR